MQRASVHIMADMAAESQSGAQHGSAAGTDPPADALASARVLAGLMSPPKHSHRRDHRSRRTRSMPRMQPRSRSPTDAEDEVPKEIAERSMVVPIYIEPGQDGDTLGLEGRHRTNMQRLFNYCAHIENIAANHVDLPDAHDQQQHRFSGASRLASA